MSITGPPLFFFVVDVFTEFYNWITESELYSCIFLGLWLGDILLGELIDTVFNCFKGYGGWEAFLLKFIFGLSVSYFLGFELNEFSYGFIDEFKETYWLTAKFYKSFYSEGRFLN